MNMITQIKLTQEYDYSNQIGLSQDGSSRHSYAYIIDEKLSLGSYPTQTSRGSTDGPEDPRLLTPKDFKETSHHASLKLKM